MFTNNELLLKWLDFFEELFKKWGVDKDCQQLIYLAFLEYDNKKLNEIDQNGDMKFWIVRLIKNNWFSTTSRYYAQYKRYYEHFEALPED